MTAKRFNLGKPQLSLPLSATKALSGMASVMEFGAEKYGRDNWKDGLPMEEIADSLLRHLTAWLNEDTTDYDDESGLHHLYHLAVNALFMAEFAEDFDDDVDESLGKPGSIVFVNSNGAARMFSPGEILDL